LSAGRHPSVGQEERAAELPRVPPRQRPVQYHASVSGEERVDPGLPPQQYVSARHVLRLMGQSGRRRVMELSAPQILVLAVVAGAFITAGALFSLLLATGVGAPGPKLLLEGIGFSSGFFFVILSDAALFTEANVAMPATLLAGGHREPHRGHAPGRPALLVRPPLTRTKGPELGPFVPAPMARPRTGSAGGPSHPPAGVPIPGGRAAPSRRPRRPHKRGDARHRWRCIATPTSRAMAPGRGPAARPAR
jgi:hypothetical protein